MRIVARDNSDFYHISTNSTRNPTIQLSTQAMWLVIRDDFGFHFKWWEDWQ